jgi:teichuronic acid biosynthesis glycosyltransferase TuaC
MKILIVSSRNSGKIAPFIQEQGDALSRSGVTIAYFPIVGKGIWGYLKNRTRLLSVLSDFQPDLIHAHYGLSGLLANMQRSVPVITTYHGSDINDKRIYLFSRLNMFLSAYNIFVSEKNRKMSGQNTRQSLIPCGVNTDLFIIKDQAGARKCLNLELNKKYILFSGAFANPVKNFVLANAAVSLLEDVKLIELVAYTREEVALLLNAVDVMLMTSLSEGSPQIIKEAMACNCPIVSVPVGDVEDVIGYTPGCFIATYEPTDIAAKLRQVLQSGKRTEGRNRVLTMGLDGDTIASKIQDIYKRLITDKQSHRG